MPTDTATKKYLTGNCCCPCIVPQPSFANVTDIKTFLHDYSPDGGLNYPDRICSDALAAGAIPNFRSDQDTFLCGGSPSDCGANGQGKGPWPAVGIPQSFGIGADHNFDKCITGGFKNVQAGKIWQGRYGFISDYLADPKVGTKYKTFAVQVEFSEDYSGNYSCYSDTDGSFVSSDGGNGNNNGSANSVHSLTVGGLENCSGSAGAGDGAVTWESVPSSGPSLHGNYWNATAACFSPSNPAVLQVPSGDNWPTIDKPAVRDGNKTLVKSWCYANADRGIITVTIPKAGVYTGPPSGFAGWLAGFNESVVNPGTYSTPDGIHFFYTKSNFTAIFSGISVTLSETSLNISVGFKTALKFQEYTVVDHSGGPTEQNGTIKYLIFNQEEEYAYSFSVSINLSDAYAASQAYDEAIALLAYWDMTDDVVYPWRQDGACRIAPLVTLNEIGGQPGFGYCDTPVDAVQAAFYNGAVYGGPQGTKGYYDPTWFDFRCQIYTYADLGSGDCNGSLCFKYGAYMPSYLPTMATQFSTGALDTSQCGAGWLPFTRYYTTYGEGNRPPFVDVACAFVGDGRDRFYAAKWAELKSNIPAQRYYGPCGAQRDVTLLDSICNPTATKRWPAAYGICGRALISSLTRDGGTGVVTVILEANNLITGDAVDFMNAADGVTTANVTITVDSSTQFHFTGSLLAGVSVKTHGAPAPSWYFDNSPKGDFVRVSNLNGALTAEAGNVVKAAGKRAIMVIAPAGSPELTDGVWPAASTAMYSDYPALQPTEYWHSSLNQVMGERLFTHSQDQLESDGAGGCQPNGVPEPIVEARLSAPAGAPYPFNTGDGNIEKIMPVAADFSFGCSGAWNDTLSILSTASWPGIPRTNAAALKTGPASSESDAGFGSADGTFIL